MLWFVPEKSQRDWLAHDNARSVMHGYGLREWNSARRRAFSWREERAVMMNWAMRLFLIVVVAGLAKRRTQSAS